MRKQEESVAKQEAMRKVMAETHAHFPNRRGNLKKKNIFLNRPPWSRRWSSVPRPT